ncbi:MAG: hypothetical protein ACTH8F_08380 [Microbacterium sp.]|uniref:hypothetical protein n=1 Tax=Microbacterium sp. TaxID=51671 RepID=UPI003F9665BF
MNAKTLNTIISLAQVILTALTAVLLGVAVYVGIAGALSGSMGDVAFAMVGAAVTGGLFWFITWVCREVRAAL